MSLDLSCADWPHRLRAGRPLVPDLSLWTEEGERAVKVFSRLRLADVPGTPLLADAGGEWFFAIVRALFGGMDAATRQRWIRELFLLVPKKNSKTTNGALLMLTALLMNQRPRANFILTGPVQDSADLAFQAAAGAIALDPVLEKILHVREHLKTIIHRETRAELQIMTFDPAVLTGQKVSGGVLIDELHVIAKMSKAASAIRQLRGGMLPFPEAFLAFITTQSEEAPAGVFRAELLKARAIRDGRQEGAMLPVLYEMPPEMQAVQEVWRNPQNWPMVTPNLGRSIQLARLIEEFNTAAATSEEELRAWASQHLNVEIGLALHSDRWAGADHWQRRAQADLTLAWLIEVSDTIAVGIDGGGLDDMLGLAILGRHAITGTWLLWSRAWLHRIALERRKAEAPRYLDFESQGDLVIVDDDSEEDITDVAELVGQVVQSGKLYKVGVDPVGIGAIVDALVADDCGVEESEVVGISQGWKLTGAIKTTERKLASGSLVHAGAPLMAWCVGNCKAEPKGNAVLITKQASGFAKIDPVMAAFNAVSLMSMAPAQNVIGEDYELTAV